MGYLGCRSQGSVICDDWCRQARPAARSSAAKVPFSQLKLTASTVILGPPLEWDVFRLDVAWAGKSQRLRALVATELLNGLKPLANFSTGVHVGTVQTSRLPVASRRLTFRSNHQSAANSRRRNSTFREGRFAPVGGCSHP